MLQRIITDIKRVRSAPQHLRHRVHTLRTEGRERLWTLQTDSLDKASALLERAESLPIVSRITPRAESMVSARLDRVCAVPIEGYDSLNARNAAAAVRDLDRVSLRKVERHERAHKNRKTVLRAVEKALG